MLGHFHCSFETMTVRVQSKWILTFWMQFAGDINIKGGYNDTSESSMNTIHMSETSFLEEKLGGE